MATRETGSTLQCAARGYQILRLRAPRPRCRALDLHPDFILDDAAAAERIEEDLFGLAGEVEIGLDIGGRRWALVAFAEDLVDEIQPLTAEDTWLVSGGGSGDGGFNHWCRSSQSESGRTFRTPRAFDAD